MEAGAGSDRKPIVLIADDDEGIRYLLATLCEGNGYEPIVTQNGRQAVAEALRRPPDVILLDALMPEMNGFEAISRLKADRRTSHIPVLILTGLTSREDRLKGIAMGANDFLTKPIDAEELLLRLRNNLKIKEFHDFLSNHAEILERQVAERTRELQQAFERLKAASEIISGSYKDAVYRLAAVAEYRDEDTGAHIRRISYFTRELAAGLGLDDKFRDMIFYAAVMHDIGKVGIPDSILLKPGQLTSEEWEVMKGHTTTGARILQGSDSPYLQMAAEIALSHHERWDGSGYPGGLKGESIPLAAQITNLADQYDALRTERPYKQAFDHEQACRILLRGDGRIRPEHFNPRLLAVFREMVERFRRIYDEHADR